MAAIQTSVTCLAIIISTLTVFVSADDPVLTFKPASGSFVAGTRAEIICDLSGKGFLDVLRVAKEVASHKYVLATNGDISVDYVNVERFAVEYEENGGQARLRFIIDPIQAEDQGNYACVVQAMNEERETMDEVTVLVNVESVTLRQETEVIEEGGAIRLTDNQETEVLCEIVVDGTDEAPDVAITLGDRDITDRFTSNPVGESDVDNKGFYQESYTATYTYRTDNPDPDDNGQTLRCTAQYPNTEFDPVVASAQLEVYYPPNIECEPKVNAQTGSTNVRLFCRGFMHPAPVQAAWSFGEGDNLTTVNNGDAGDIFSAGVDSLDNGEYELWLTITEVQKPHFQTYSLSTSNGVGPAINHDIVLHSTDVEVPEPEVEPTPHTEPESESTDNEVDSNVAGNNAEQSGFDNAASRLATLWTLFIVLVAIALL